MKKVLLTIITGTILFTSTMSVQSVQMANSTTTSQPKQVVQQIETKKLTTYKKNYNLVISKKLKTTQQAALEFYNLCVKDKISVRLMGGKSEADWNQIFLNGKWVNIDCHWKDWDFKTSDFEAYYGGKLLKESLFK